MIDEEDSRPRAPKLDWPILDPLSIAELEAYIATLEAEIGRVRQHIAGKQSHRASAESIFKR